MNRREVLGSVGAAAAGLAALSAGIASADEKGEGEAHAHKNQMHADCLKACAECARACDEAFHHCMMEAAQGKKEHVKSAHLLSDCAAFCNLSACMIARHSPLLEASCSACADACKATTAEVRQFESSGEAMAKVVRALKECEGACRAMSSCSCDECKECRAEKTAAR